MGKHRVERLYKADECQMEREERGGENCGAVCRGGRFAVRDNSRERARKTLD
jgi:hypothetical protein